jgi:hypothetical protein
LFAWNVEFGEEDWEQTEGNMATDTPNGLKDAKIAA